VTKAKLRRLIPALLMTLAGLFTISPAVDSSYFPTTCGTYNNSSVQYQSGYGGYCGGYGGVCGECSTGYSGGYSVCVTDNFGGSVCTDYQDF
jgi:hypothetical protein